MRSNWIAHNTHAVLDCFWIKEKPCRRSCGGSRNVVKKKIGLQLLIGATMEGFDAAETEIGAEMGLESRRLEAEACELELAMPSVLRLSPILKVNHPSFQS